MTKKFCLPINIEDANFDGMITDPKVVQQIQTVTINSSVKDYKFTTLRKLFKGLVNLTEIKRVRTVSTITYIDASNVTDMSYMFDGDAALVQGVDLSRWAAVCNYKVTDISGMFRGCSSLQSVTMGDVDFHSATSFNDAFKGCPNSISFNVSADTKGNFKHFAATNASALGLDMASVQWNAGGNYGVQYFTLPGVINYNAEKNQNELTQYFQVFINQPVLREMSIDLYRTGYTWPTYFDDSKITEAANYSSADPFTLTQAAKKIGTITIAPDGTGDYSVGKFVVKKSSDGNDDVITVLDAEGNAATGETGLNAIATTTEDAGSYMPSAGTYYSFLIRDDFSLPTDSLLNSRGYVFSGKMGENGDISVIQNSRSEVVKASWGTDRVTLNIPYMHTAFCGSITSGPEGYEEDSIVGDSTANLTLTDKYVVRVNCPEYYVEYSGGYQDDYFTMSMYKVGDEDNPTTIPAYGYYEGNYKDADGNNTARPSYYGDFEYYSIIEDDYYDSKVYVPYFNAKDIMEGTNSDNLYPFGTLRTNTVTVAEPPQTKVMRDKDKNLVTTPVFTGGERAGQQGYVVRLNIIPAENSKLWKQIRVWRTVNGQTTLLDSLKNTDTYYLDEDKSDSYAGNYSVLKDITSSDPIELCDIFFTKAMPADGTEVTYKVRTYYETDESLSPEKVDQPLSEAKRHNAPIMRAGMSGGPETPNVYYYVNEETVVVKFTPEGVVTSVNDIDAAAQQPVSTSYVNLAGQQSATPWHGVNIVLTKMADGSTKAEKKMMK